LGAGIEGIRDQYELCGDANAIIALALRRVIRPTPIVVAAAGNGGPTAHRPSPPTNPASSV